MDAASRLALEASSRSAGRSARARGPADASPPIARPPLAHIAEAGELSIPHPSPARALQRRLDAAFGIEDAPARDARRARSSAHAWARAGLVLGSAILALALTAAVIV